LVYLKQFCLSRVYIAGTLRILCQLRKKYKPLLLKELYKNQARFTFIIFILKMQNEKYSHNEKSKGRR
jgi:hypothetical protein